MITFLIGLFVLALGGALYGRVCEKVFSPEDRTTPAVAKNDGVDFVPMKGWKNALVQLLNIAGTGPVLGPIQGALFGPIAFITIPIGCVLGGALHDYMCGMISMRHEGAHLPELVGRYLGKRAKAVYLLFVCLLLTLLGTVFIYTPGDLLVTQVFRADSGVGSSVLWIVYGVIFLYYLAATLFPVDKIIGRIYPIFGAVLILSALGVLAGIVFKGYPLPEIWQAGVTKAHFLPIFFVTVACGVVSGFHGTQSPIVARTVTREKQGRMIFYNMMIAEGFIAMIWAAATMGILQLGRVAAETVENTPTDVIGVVAKDLLGSVGGMTAVVSVIVLGITSGDTALRSLRMMIGDALRIDQTKKTNRLAITCAIFVVVAALLVFSKVNADGFSILWRYFAWANQVLAVFAFAMITLYLAKRRRPFVMSLIPGTFYAFVVTSFLLNAKIGLRLSWNVSYPAGVALALVYCGALLILSRKAAARSID